MSTLSGRSFIVTALANYGVPLEVDGSDGFTNVRRIAAFDTDGTLVGDGLKSVIADCDTSNIAALPGYVPVQAKLNRVYAWQLTVPKLDGPFTVANMSVILCKPLRPFSKWSVGLYDSAGTTKLLDTAPLDATVTGIRTIAQANVVINPGQYWLALTTPPAVIYEDVSLGQVLREFRGSYHAVQRDISDARVAFNYNQPAPRMVIAGNPSVSGQLPASLGTLTTPQDGNNAALPPWILLN